MLPSRCSSPCLGGATIDILSFFWERGSNESKRKTMNWSEMEELALERTFHSLVVLTYMYKNRLALIQFPVPMIVGSKK